MGRFNWMRQVICKGSAVGTVTACTIVFAPTGAQAITVTTPTSDTLVLNAECNIKVEAGTYGQSLNAQVQSSVNGGIGVTAVDLTYSNDLGWEDYTPWSGTYYWSATSIETLCNLSAGSITNIQTDHVLGRGLSEYASFSAGFTYNTDFYSVHVTGSGIASVTKTSETPTADASTDQTVASGATVTLDATGSSGMAQPFTYVWSQINISGSTVDLSNINAAQPTFIAPALGVNDGVVTLEFSLEVTNSNGDTSTADTVSITVNPETASAASDFAAKEDAIRSVITDDAQRSLNNTLASNTRLTRKARGRFLTSRAQMQSDGAGLASRNNIALDVDGIVVATPEQMSTQGVFFAQTGNFGCTKRRLVFGDFDIQRDGDTGSTTATISGKIAWEQMLSEQTMLGYYLGGEVVRSNIRGSFTGTQDKYGVSIGGYFVHALQENLFLDGFASLGAGRNNLEMADDTLDLTSEYTTQTVTLGAAVSGVIEQNGYDILPELSVAYGRTTIGSVGFTGVAYGLTDDTLSLDAGSVSTATIMFRPEFRVSLDGQKPSESLSTLSFAPRVMCERVQVASTTNNCGFGAELGISSSTQDGLTSVTATIVADRVGNSTRSSLQLNLEHKF
jgi:hypothetical protein